MHSIEIGRHCPIELMEAGIYHDFPSPLCRYIQCYTNACERKINCIFFDIFYCPIQPISNC